MLSNDREFYDLCRKYKYFYKSYKEVEKLKEVYWSKYVQEAYKEVKSDLDNIEKEIIDLVLDELLGGSNITIERDIEVNEMFDSSKPYVKGINVIISDDNFANILMNRRINRR